MTRHDGPSAYSVIVSEIRRTVGAYPVVLCGSRATGDASPTSDYDVVVVVPGYRLPLELRRLYRAQESLRKRLDASITVNPVPGPLLERKRTSLFLWKVREESRVLDAPRGFQLAVGGPPPLNDEVVFSYLLSGVFYLLDGVRPTDLARERLPPRTVDGLRKALMHVAQLRLLRAGTYATGLAQSLERLGDRQIGEVASTIDRPSAWFSTRCLIVTELGRRPPRQGLALSLARNLQYVSISALRGRPRWAALLDCRAVDRRLAVSAVRLLSALRSSGTIDQSYVVHAWDALPRVLRRQVRPDWSPMRNLLELEWPAAHPVLGL